MPFIQKITYYQKFYLQSEVRSMIIDNEDEFYPKLYFVTNYLLPYDINGNHPPRFLLIDGEINDLVENELKKMNVSNLYCAYNELDYSYITMRTIYVIDDLNDRNDPNNYDTNEISRQDARTCKMTEFKVTIKRIERSYECNDTTTVTTNEPNRTNITTTMNTTTTTDTATCKNNHKQQQQQHNNNKNNKPVFKNNLNITKDITKDISKNTICNNNMKRKYTRKSSQYNGGRIVFNV